MTKGTAKRNRDSSDLSLRGNITHHKLLVKSAAFGGAALLGHYAKALGEDILHFTGISTTYEEPEHPDVTVQAIILSV